MTDENKPEAKKKTKPPEGSTVTDAWVMAGAPDERAERVATNMISARMSSIERKGPATMPREMHIRASWGNVELDLRESTFSAGVTTIDVRVMMGNVELTVPPHVRVEIEASTFAANVESERDDRPRERLMQDANPTRLDGRLVGADGAVSETAGEAILRITGRVRLGNLEVHRMWPGETHEERAWRRRRERMERHGHRFGFGHHGHHGHGHGHGPGSGPGVGGPGGPGSDVGGPGVYGSGGPGGGLGAHDPSGDEPPRRRWQRWHDRWHGRDWYTEEVPCDPFDDGDRIDHGKGDERETRAERRERRKRRWRELHAEREMWRKNRKRGQQWVPWWLMSRMRRRIFLWLAIALGGGIAIGIRVTETPAWWWVAIGLLVLSMVSGAIAFRLTRPLIMVVKAARDIGDGKLDTRLDARRHGGETRVLAEAINDMAEKIEQQMSDQRQLLAAVSHELRTPLGHMRVLVETARNGGGDPRGVTKRLDEIDREIIVLDDLVGKLLASSRLEFGNLERRPLELGELVSDAAIAAGVAPEAIEVSEDVRAVGDPTLVKRAVANLLDNARVHGKGAVAVRVERRAGLIAIEVDDVGPGVPEERRADAFRAFGPSTANATQGGSGLGLGLALVSRIAVAHGGGAWISERPGGGARVGFSIGAAGHQGGPASEPDPAVVEHEERRD